MAPAEQGRNEQIRDALRRMLEHPQFARTKVLKALVEYLVERALSNDTISESGIASAVFEIPAEEFHPYTHTNVRVQMHNLRKKLDLYYAEAASETIRITLPENSYSPVFEMVGQLAPETRRTLNQARLLAESRFPADLHDAMALIDEVLSAAPSLGQAWAIRAEIQIMLAVHGEPPLATLRAAASDADRALALAPESWEAHLMKGAVSTMLDWDWSVGEHHFAQAIKLGGGIRAETNPWRQLHLLALGRAADLVPLMEKLLETQESPSHMAQTNYGIALHLARRHADADRELQRAAVLYPHDHSALSWLATVQWTTGHKVRALATQVKAHLRARRSPPGRLLALSAEGMRAATTGREPLPLSAETEGGSTEMAVALTAVIMGREEKAIDAFERMAKHRFPLLPFLIHLEIVDGLWKNPRFLTLIQGLKLPASALRYRLAIK